MVNNEIKSNERIKERALCDAEFLLGSVELLVKAAHDDWSSQVRSAADYCSERSEVIILRDQNRLSLKPLNDIKESLRECPRRPSAIGGDNPDKIDAVGLDIPEQL